MKKTALHSRHLALHAKMGPFAGFEMPLQYKSILQEHKAVREGVGLFDVSHMGIIRIVGRDLQPFLESISTNTIPAKEGVATYTLFCNENGFVVDDLIVYRLHQEEALLVVNAANREKDLVYLQKRGKSFHVKIEPLFDGWGIIALQGPKTPEIEAMSHMRVKPYKEGYIATTGYTGERGYEFLVPDSMICSLWDQFMEQGAEPIGLGARDTLRLEMGYALYGHELSEEIHPLESVAAWAYKKEKVAVKRHAFGVVMESSSIPREKFLVFVQGKIAGVVTSGGYSPTLKRAIALILVDQKVVSGDTVEIEIRGVREKAKVVPLPFIRRER